VPQPTAPPRDENHKELNSRPADWVENQTHYHVDTKRARYPLLTANVQQQQQLYFVSHAASKVVTFGLLIAETLVQSQGVDKSSYICPVSEYLDMFCDSPFVTHGQKNTAELTGCILKISVQVFQKFGNSFYLLSNTDGNPWTTDTKLVGSVELNTVTKHNLANHYTETQQKIMFIFITYIF
jgi:hypothetical protein